MAPGIRRTALLSSIGRQDLFFVPNAINRYDLAQRDRLMANPDGSVDIYLQAESPGKDREANWLPAPKGKFVLVMRL